ncbi:MAG TPA: UvrD-helicase domain-containing protein [Hydrogenophaga sp.]
MNGQTVGSADFYAVACDPGRSVAVEACAGAGKTWMLVARIVRALLDGTPAQNILAITFTKKAAAEMRGRLQRELRECETLPDAELLARLKAWGFAEEQAAARLAGLRGLNARVNAQGRTVQVRTFHSWFAALLRSAPLAVLQELNLPLSYELLEDDARATSLVWPRLYRALADAPAERQDFFDSVAEHGRHQTLKSLENALSKRVEFAMADAAGVVDDSVKPFDQLWPELAHVSQPEEALLGEAVRQRWLAWAKALGGESLKSPQAAAQAVVDAFELPDEPGQMARRLAVLRKAFFVASEDRLSRNLAKYEVAQAAEAELQRLCGASHQHQAWHHHQRLARLTRLLLRVYADLKRERAWVDMNDLEGAAQRLLGDAELSGWMQQRMDARVSQLLIDEFQDTNPLQWQALYGWLSAYSGAGPGEAPSVFLVGDPKQSIYRFRRAEPQVFKAAQAFVLQGLDGALLSCDHTRRCSPAVVETLNAVMQRAVAAGEYSGFRDHTTASSGDGGTWVLPAIEREEGKPRGEGQEAAPWRDSLSEPRVLPEEESYAAREAQQAARWISRQIHERGMKPKAIMVLSRKRSRLGAMHSALQALGIPSEQPEKLELNQVAAVQDVIALLDALVSPRHNLSLARALKSPLFQWSDADLVTLAEVVRQARSRSLEGPDRGLELSWWDALQRLAGSQEGLDGALATRVVDTAARLTRYRAWVVGLPPHDALSAIYEDSQVLARFAQVASSAQRAPVVAALRDVLLQSLVQDGGRFLSAYRLVRLLKSDGAMASMVQKNDAVRLLTVHGAKGLEADTVLLLDTDSGSPAAESMGVLIDWPGEAPRPRRFVFLERETRPPVCAEDLLLAEQQARALEEVNALYVALTRAEHRLVVSSFTPHRRAEKASWWERLQPLGELLETPVDAVACGMGMGDGFEMPTLPPLVATAVGSGLGGEAQMPALVVDDDVRTRLGLAMHRLLQWHPSEVGFDWGQPHLQAVAREHALSAAQAQEALTMARSVVGGEGAWAWDASQLAWRDNEVEMVWEGAGLRLDRLVQTLAGEWWVIDFKSHPEPELQPAYLTQIRQYGRAVLHEQPGAVVRLAFVNALGQWREVGFT